MHLRSPHSPLFSTIHMPLNDKRILLQVSANLKLNENMEVKKELVSETDVVLAYTIH